MTSPTFRKDVIDLSVPRQYDDYDKLIVEDVVNCTIEVKDPWAKSQG